MGQRIAQNGKFTRKAFCARISCVRVYIYYVCARTSLSTGLYMYVSCGFLGSKITAKWFLYKSAVSLSEIAPLRNVTFGYKLCDPRSSFRTGDMKVIAWRGVRFFPILPVQTDKKMPRQSLATLYSNQAGCVGYSHPSCRNLLPESHGRMP